MRLTCSFTYCLCFFALGTCFAQKKNTFTDSLRNVIQTSSHDTQRVIALNELAWIYRNSDYQKSYRYGLQSEKLALKISYSKGLATAYNRIGLIHQNKGEYQQALNYYQKALKIEQQIKHLYGISRAKNQIGSIYMLTRKYKKAIPYFEESIKILIAINQTSKIAIKKINLAICYDRLGDIKKSINYYIEALKVYQTSKVENQIGKCYSGLGELYRQAGNFKKAHNYLTKAIGVFCKKKNKTSLARVYQMLGLLYFNIQDYKKALTFYQKSLHIKKKLKSNQGVQGVLNNMGYVYLKLSQPNRARVIFEQSYNIAIQKKDTSTLAVLYINLGLLNKQKKKYRQAIGYFLKSLALAHKVSDRYTRRDVLENLSYTYAKLNQYEKSFKYFNRYKWARDSLEASFREALQLKDAYEKEKKAKESLAKDQKIKLTQLAHLKEYSFRQTLVNYFLGIGFLLLLILLLALVKNYQERRKVRKKQAKIDHLLQEQEFVALSKMLEGQEKERKRISEDLHDRVGSMLSVVKLHFEALNQSPDLPNITNVTQYQQGTKLLDEACDAVRDVSHNISSSALERFGLVAALQDLKSKIEYTNVLEVKLASLGLEEDRLSTKYETQAYRIVQELINNVLKHANASLIKIHLIYDEDSLHIQVEDNGKGFEVAKLHEKKGIGSVESRVKVLKGTYDITSHKGKGTSVTIDIPVKNI